MRKSWEKLLSLCIWVVSMLLVFPSNPSFAIQKGIILYSLTGSIRNGYSDVPFFSGYYEIFEDSVNAKKPITRILRRSVEKVCFPYDYCNFLAIIKSALKKKGINVYSPKVEFDVNKMKIKTEEFSLLQKKKYPIELVVKEYDFRFYNKGEEKSPILGWGDWKFNGKVWFRARIIMELRSTKTGELIDKIEFKKVYPPEDIKLVVHSGTSLNFKEGKEKLESYVRKTSQIFINDIKNLILKYQWNEVFSLVQ